VPLQEVFKNLIRKRLFGSEKPPEIPDGRRTALDPSTRVPKEEE
jgi:hypothetical protein